MDRTQCIRVALRCDGKRDCKDGTDEDAVACLNKTSCPSGQFTCRSTLEGSATCLPRTFLCDGFKHCVDGSDEDCCESRICDPGEFRCDGGQCISQHSTCDDKRDCQDGSDENLMLCLAYKSICPSPQMPCNSLNGSLICVDESRKCDGHVDCKNGIDERFDCAALAFNCRGSFFRCDNRRCVPNGWRCDGDDDCFDGSDEKGCADNDDERLVNCPVTEFACSSGTACVALNLRCDHRTDCPDGSDEIDCPTDLFNFL
ncbi:low-density lipoprotein receptor-like [Rhipicephalus sanguineus]|uniref:low-density lipoprotein receptor-like n=1 Tax=Rhipicephalus sanguineus TaxID=34632 RepID=UPI001893DF0D|nr:low-density lipoprotein receptor-like [Rhipicephalus sanguineus]